MKLPSGAASGVEGASSGGAASRGAGKASSLESGTVLASSGTGAWPAAESCGNVIAIPEAGSPVHVKENAVALSLSLTPQELQTLDTAFPGPSGPDYPAKGHCCCACAGRDLSPFPLSGTVKCYTPVEYRTAQPATTIGRRLRISTAQLDAWIGAGGVRAVPFASNARSAGLFLHRHYRHTGVFGSDTSCTSKDIRR